MKKNILIVLSSFLFLSFTTLLGIHLYNVDQVKQLGFSVGEYAWDNPVSLGDLLYFNNANLSEDDYNIETGSNTWRNKIAENPNIAYNAVNLYFDDFINAYKSGFEARKKLEVSNFIKKEIRSEYELEMIMAKNADEFLNLTFGNINKYQALINDLLKLDEQRLNTLVNSIENDPGANNNEDKMLIAKDLKQWLALNGHLNNPEDMASKGLPNYAYFPTDVILLTYRISSNYGPNWTNRKTLEQMKAFSEHVQKKFNSKN